MPIHAVPRLALSYDELASAIGCTRRHIENLVRRGEINAVSIGGRRVVTMPEVERILGGGHDAA